MIHMYIYGCQLAGCSWRLSGHLLTLDGCWLASGWLLAADWLLGGYWLAADWLPAGQGPAGYWLAWLLAAYLLASCWLVGWATVGSLLADF